MLAPTRRRPRPGDRCARTASAAQGAEHPLGLTGERPAGVGQVEGLSFPDVPAALARLNTRYKVAVLSNGDPDMLEAANSFHKMAFDAAISVAAANSFKPHVVTYTKAAELLGVRMDEVLFVANHAFDCIGAKSAGRYTAFMNRRMRPFGMTPHQPDIVVPDMKGLADRLA